MDLSDLTDDQRDCAKCLERPLLVCAGAGSGKTFMLTQRLAYAFDPESGPFLDDIDQVLIITFTDAAAAEIKTRVRQTLRRSGLVDQALKVDGAWISTIHGMCSRIMRAHALEAGIDPDFKLVMGPRQQQLMEIAIEAALNDEAVRSAAGIDELFDVYGTFSLRTMLNTLLADAASLTDGLDAMRCSHTEQDPTELVRQLEALLQTGEQVLTRKGSADLCAQGAAEVRHLREQGLADDWDAVAACVSALSFPTKEQLSAKQRGDDYDEQDDVRLQTSQGIKIAAKQIAIEHRQRAMRPREDALLLLARTVQNRYDEAKHANGMIDPSDLIRATMKLLQDRPDIAAEYRNRFRLQMVDEFQDTSQLQIDMISSIAGQDCAHLCTVGDAQQSIYRFQGADVNVYLQHKAHMASPGVGALRKELKANYRSDPDILGFVRTICGQDGYFVEDFLDLDPQPRKSIYRGGDDPRIEVALTEHAYRGGKQGVRASAAHIAERFAELRDAGQSPGDMVVLLGRMTNASVYAEELRARGLACVVAGGSRFFESDEITLCLNLLHTLACANDSASLLPLLASEMLPVSSDDLLLLATVKAETEPLPRRQDISTTILERTDLVGQPSNLLIHACNVLRRAWNRAGTETPSRVFSVLLVESGWLARMEHQGVEGQAKAGNVIKFVRLMQEAEQTAGSDLRQVSQMMDAMKEDGGEKPGALSVEGGRAVRIMTIHSSKGLQFPVVAVGDFYAAGRHGSALHTLTDIDVCHLSLGPGSDEFPDLPGGSGCTWTPKLPQPFFQMSHDDFRAFMDRQTPGALRAMVDARNVEEDLMERRRLFYVALTRASEALIVSLVHGFSKSSKKQNYPGVMDDVRKALMGESEDLPQESMTMAFDGTRTLRYTYLDVRSTPDDDADAANANADGAGGRGTCDDGGACAAATASAGTTVIAAFPDADDSAGAAQADDEIDDLDGSGSIGKEPIVIPPLTEVAPLVLRSFSSRADFCSYSSLAAHLPAAAIEDAVHMELEDEGSSRRANDADAATDFGSALHRACELLAWHAPAAADAQAIAAAAAGIDLNRLARAYGVRDIDRLKAAFMRWTQSELCARALGFPLHQPEVPFTLNVDGFYLEGEIDLLCSDGSGGAFVVDYKTGGDSSETADLLSAKHQLQAQCYAAAALDGGFDKVELHFARVEQLDDATGIQQVDYAFSSNDKAALEAAIAEAHALAEV